MRPIYRRYGKEMNKAEQKYAQQLELMKRAGEIMDYRYERIKLKLADNTFYTPDFFVIYKDRFEFHEVKGFWEDDARVKYKVAQEQFPFFDFKTIQRLRK